MRVVQPKPEIPVERKTLIELTDREIALIHRGVTLDNPSSEQQRKLHDDQYKIFSEFDALIDKLKIASIADA
jgi:hypothetical protein